MKNNRIYLSPPHMGGKERKHLTNACPEFTGYIEGLSIQLIRQIVDKSQHWFVTSNAHKK